MVSRFGELPSTVRVQCPDCSVFASLSFQYTEGDRGDYEGVFDAEREGGGPCGASMLWTVTIPEEATAQAVSWQPG